MMQFLKLRNKDKSNYIEAKNIDVYLLFVTFLLVLIGLVMVYSSSAVLAGDHYNNNYFFIKKQLIFAAAGFFVLFIVQGIPYRIYWRLNYPLLLFVSILLILTYIFGHGAGSENVNRWLRVGGISLGQPSELAKIAVIIFTAYALAKKGDMIRDFKKGYLPVVAISGLVILLILIGRDLGSAFTLGLVVFLMLFISGTKLSYLLGTILASLPFLYYLIFAVDFRRRRIESFLDPWEHRLDSGFQLIQSFVAFQNGGLTGVGLGQGKQKLFYLPEAHTDFIFSVLGEELGLLGVICVITLFIVFIFRGLALSIRTQDLFGLYLGFGLTCLIGAEAFLNISVVMGLLPTKGLALPFISYGGSSMLMSLFAVGILLNISRYSVRD